MVTETTVPSPNTFPAHDPGGTGIDEPGDHGPSDERSHSTLHNWFRVFQLDLPGSQEGWGMAPSDQPKDAEQLHRNPTLQDGNNQQPEGCNQARGLARQNRLEGRVPHDPSTSTRPEVPEIHVEGTGLPIHLFTLRSVDRTESLLEGDATSDGSAEGERGTDDPVPGRYPSTFRVEGEALFPHTDGGYSTRRSRLPIEQEEVSADPLPGNRVLGVHGQLGQPVTHPARRESQENQEGVPKIAKLTSYLREKSCSPDRPTQLNHGRSSSCPPLLQGSTAVEKSGGHPQRRQLRNRVHCGSRVSHRFEVVGGPSGSLQRPTNNAPFSRIGDRVRCLNQRMGSALQWLPDRRALEQPRSNSTHQHSRAEGMFPGSPNICIGHDELPCVTANGQSDGSVLCQQERRNSFEGPIRPGLRHLAMVLVEETDYSRTILAREVECQSGLRITEFQRRERLDARPGSLPETPRQVGCSVCRSLCCPPQCSSGQVLQLQTRSLGDGSGCSGPNMGQLEAPLCLPTIHINRQVPSEDQEGASGFSDSDCSCMGNPDMVPPPLGNVSGRTCDSPSEPHTTEQPSQTHPPPPGSEESAPNGVAGVRNRWQKEGISEKASELITASWRSGTRKSYNSAWRKWASWCAERGQDPFSSPVKEILDFLAFEFESGKQYSTMNSYRSALSAFHMPIEGYAVGTHPLVLRLLQGMFNQRPPQPRYESTWNVNVVLAFLAKLPDNKDLSLVDLTSKLVMLMALANADRASDLNSLDTRYMQYTQTGVTFKIPGLTKTRRSGPPIVAFYPVLESNTSLCPVSTLKAYMEATKEIRQETKHVALFLSVKKPHNPVSNSTVSRWLKALMAKAGIDTTRFKAHSTRAAATSKAKATGVSMADILKAAVWSRESTFEQFYHRPIQASTFGPNVLDSLQNVSFELIHCHI